jgi:FkbM family methyltransferase
MKAADRVRKHGISERKCFMLEYDCSLMNSLLPNAQGAVRWGLEARHIEAHCTTLDNFCADYDIKRIDALNIDTEGFDFYVLPSLGPTP